MEISSSVSSPCVAGAAVIILPSVPLPESQKN